MQDFDFNRDWYFQKIGPEGGPGVGKEPIPVTLPHDAMLHDERDPKSPGGAAGAFFVPGCYQYTKTFRAPAEWEGKHVELYFGGVYKNASVYLNEQLIKKHSYGYTPFTVNLDEALKAGEENTLRVVADNSKLPNTRWYSGAGIYRNVTLRLGNKTHLASHPLKIKVVNYKPAKIYFETRFVDGLKTGIKEAEIKETEIKETGIKEGGIKETGSKEGALQKEVKVKLEILDQGRRVAAGEGEKCTLKIPAVKNWSAENPYLYTVKVYLEQDGHVVDEYETEFGVRGIEWSSAGLHINGRETKLRGGCIHHDNGLLGACSYYEAEERRLSKMKALGFNAVRIAHNPASDELLKAADKVGMYVMDETFDMWYIQKNAYDYALDFEANWKDDVKAMVVRDQTHPSVIMYSVGNELSEPAKKQGQDKAQEMMDFIWDLDNSRPVTAGLNIDILTAAKYGMNTYSDNGFMTGSDKSNNLVENVTQKITGSLLFNTLYQKVGFAMNIVAMLPVVDSAIKPICDILHISGYNYGSFRYTMDLKKYPARIIVGSETLPPDIYKNWSKVEKHHNLIGDFMWAGWDYMGEAGVGTWNYEGINLLNAGYPWILAGSGVFDINGNPDGSAFYASTVWGKSKQPLIAVQPVNHPGESIAKSAWRGTNARPTWSWKNCDGNTAVVEVYADATMIELILNGKSVGFKKTFAKKATFRVPYAPGTLEAVAYNLQNQEVGRSKLTSAQGELHVALLPEVTEAAMGDLIYVPLEVQDANGVLEANADVTVSVEVEGGQLLGLGNASPKNAEPYTGSTCTTYYGQAMAIVRAGASENVTVKVTTFTEPQKTACASTTAEISISVVD